MCPAYPTIWPYLVLAQISLGLSQLDKRGSPVLLLLGQKIFRSTPLPRPRRTSDHKTGPGSCVSFPLFSIFLFFLLLLSSFSSLVPFLTARTPFRAAASGIGPVLGFPLRNRMSLTFRKSVRFPPLIMHFSGGDSLRGRAGRRPPFSFPHPRPCVHVSLAPLTSRDLSSALLCFPKHVAPHFLSSLCRSAGLPGGAARRYSPGVVLCGAPGAVFLGLCGGI